MRYLPRAFIQAVIIIVLSALSFSADVMPAEFVPGEILIKFRGSAGKSAITGLLYNAGTVRKKEFSRIRVQLLELPDDMSVSEAVEYYGRDPLVEYAEPNYIVHADSTPDDPSFSQLWGLHNTGQSVNGSSGTADADIDAPEAWDLTTGSSDVVIAVIDSGLAYNHPDFYDPVDHAISNIWINAAESGPSCTDNDDDNSNGIIDDCDECGNGIDDDGNGYIDDCRGWDFIGNDNDPVDYYDGIGHGTHVSGTIAAFGNNGTAIAGVMWRAKIMPLRFLGITGSGSTSDAISAILYASANGADVINNSWGGTGFSRALKDAIDASNTVVVCAAGNTGTDNDSTPHYPSGFDSLNIISVAATGSTDALAGFSNYGSVSVDIAAPGTGIYSTVPTHGYGTPVDLYSTDFNSDPSGSMPAGWSRGGSAATWAITDNTGANGTGDNTLEDSPAGSYVNNTVSWAGYMTPLPGVKDNIYTLSFSWKGLLEEDFDFLDINYSEDGAVWAWIDYRTGSTSGQFISDSTSDFTAIAEMSSSFYFGFGLTSDEYSANDGVYIDNVTLSRKPILITSYDYDFKQGTSMAAPHVSGVAGLIKSLSPGLTNLEIKDAIIKSIDAKRSLEGRVTTGGRLNALKALEYSLSPYAPSGLTLTPVSISQISLDWKDNASSEDGFNIERKESGSGAFSLIASVSPDTTSYNDTGLTTEKAYSYRVRVYGPSLGDNAYSNEVSSTARPASGSGGGGGGCFIATAAYGSIMHPYVKKLREFRDRHLLDNSAGRIFVELYYKYSPPAAEVISESEGLRLAARILLTPLVMAVMFPYASLGVFIVMLFAAVVSTRRPS